MPACRVSFPLFTFPTQVQYWGGPRPRLCQGAAVLTANCARSVAFLGTYDTDSFSFTDILSMSLTLKFWKFTITGLTLTWDGFWGWYMRGTGYRWRHRSVALHTNWLKSTCFYVIRNPSRHTPYLSNRLCCRPIIKQSSSVFLGTFFLIMFSSWNL